METLPVEPEANPAGHPAPTLSGQGGAWQGRFTAMASPCEILLDGGSRQEAVRALEYASRETWRLERKFSRYVPGNPVDRINRSNGQPVRVDPELALMLDYAQQCYQLSEGRFDITSGVLRRAWRFDGSDRLPEQALIDALLQQLGWDRLSWRPPELRLPAGMELDFGGIGKEFAVDRVLLGLQKLLPGRGLLVNFGGDLACSGPRRDGRPWHIGVEDCNLADDSRQTLALRGGALATSGDSRRYLIHNGIRYSHILDPRTGWPVPDAPHSVTVAAASCTLAGMLATFAMLQGEAAETFLNHQQVDYWVQR